MAETAGGKVLEAVSKEAATDAKGQARSRWRRYRSCCKPQGGSHCEASSGSLGGKCSCT